MSVETTTSVNNGVVKGVEFEEAIQRCKFGKFNYILILLAGGLMGSGFAELNSVSFILPFAQCDLEMSSTHKGILGAIGYVGVILSSHLWGFLADTKGRRATLIPTLLIAFVVTVLSSLANNFWLLLFLRFINGFFITCASSTTFAYLGEFHDAKNRARVLMIASILYSSVNMLVPSAAMLTINEQWSFYIDFLNLTFKPWRLYLIICSIPNLLWALVLIFVIPESPKFTFSQGSEEETLKILQQMYRMNTGNSVESFDVKTIVKSAEFNECLKEKSQGFFQFMWSQSVPLFKGKNLRNILTACYIQFAICNSTNAFHTFLPEILNKLTLWSEASMGPATVCEVYVSTNLTHSQNGGYCVEKLEVSTFLHVFEVGSVYIVAYVILSMAINRTGKLILLLIIVWSSGLAALLLLFVKIPDLSSYLYMGIILSGLAISIVNASTVELFPTSMRAMAICLSMMVGRLGSSVGSIFIGTIINSYCSWTFMMPTFLLITSGFLAFTIPDISKRTHQK